MHKNQRRQLRANQSEINVDQKINELKAKFPELSSLQGTEVKDLIQKVLSLDKQQALKTLAAFHILRNLQEYRELSSGGTDSTVDNLLSEIEEMGRGQLFQY